MKRKILLFNSRNSFYFASGIDEFREIIVSLSSLAPFDIEVIDVTENPELAEKYHIDALPTLIIGNKRYIGQPDAQKAIKIFKENT